MDISEWKLVIRQRLTSLQVDPVREAFIVEELAQELADCYAEWRARGASEAAAFEHTHADKRCACVSSIRKGQVRTISRRGSGRGNLDNDWNGKTSDGQRLTA